jgi:alpha-L-fucosidase
MLSIPVRGEGTIDADEVAVLEGIAAWMQINSEGIYATRPWQVYGEGPSTNAPLPKGRASHTTDARTYTPEDYRFTTKGDTLYAFLMTWPDSRRAVIKSLATNSPQLAGRKVAHVTLLGHGGKINWTQDDQGLNVSLPPTPPGAPAVTLRIKGVLA